MPNINFKTVIMIPQSKLSQNIALAVFLCLSIINLSDSNTKTLNEYSCNLRKLEHLERCINNDFLII